MQSGYIYKIHCNITGEDYYGSTIRDIEKRISDHVSHFKCDTNIRKCASAQIIERDDWCYEIMEEVDYIIKTDLYIRETYYIKNYPCINILIPYRTNDEWREYNKLRLRTHRKNPSYTLPRNEYARIKHDCPCGGKYTNCSKAPHFKTKIHQRYINNN